MLGVDELLDTLASAAWQLFSREAEASHFDRGNLLDAICAAGHSRIEAERLLPHLMDMGFLECCRREEKEHFKFCHPTFRDFFAALHVASLINRDGWESAEVDAWQENSGWVSTNIGLLFDVHAFEPSWELLAIFTVGLLIEPLPLFAMLADRKRDDLYRHRLGLLCRCYQALRPASQTDIARKLPSVFAEVLRIARRCEHDDPGHRMPWIEWVEQLLPSPDGVEHLCDELLALNGRYRGWAVSLKVLELFERVLIQGKVPATSIDTIARYAERDDHQWGVNTACLALRLCEESHKQKLLARFVSVFEHPATSDGVKIRLAEAVATADDAMASHRAGEMLISYAQNDLLAYESSERATSALLRLLNTSLAPIAAPILVNNLLNPSSRHHFWLAWRIIGKSEKEPDNPWSAAFLAIILFADREDDQRLKLWSAQVLTKNWQPHLRDLGLRVLSEMI